MTNIGTFTAVSAWLPGGNSEGVCRTRFSKQVAEDDSALLALQKSGEFFVEGTPEGRGKIP